MKNDCKIVRNRFMAAEISIAFISLDLSTVKLHDSGFIFSEIK